MSGPLQGRRVIELAGIGPGPFAGMLLSDMGADVIRVDRVAAPDGRDAAPWWDVTMRGRRSVCVDLKRPEGREVVLRLVESADALIEGFRPGVVERLGVGPEACLARRPSLVYGRMTGWGQSGPWASLAGRDMTYLALSGTLAMIGRAGGPPVPPLNLVCDYGGGALFAFGVVCAMLEASASGRGQVVDASMLEGGALLAAVIHGLRAAGEWGPRGTNLLDGGAWFYEVYETADGRYLAFGAIDPRNRRELLEVLGLPPDLPEAWERSGWEAMKRRVAAIVRTRTRKEWEERFSGSDACVAPVLGPDEAPDHPQLAAREVFVDVGGVRQPAPAPRLSRTPPAVQGPPSRPGAHTDEVLASVGFGARQIADLRQAGIVA